MTPNVVCAHTIYLHEDENWTYLCGDESNISRGMHIKKSGTARDLSTLTHSSQFPSSPIFPPFSPRFSPVFPRFSPLFFHLYPLTYVTDFPLIDPLVKNPLLYPAPKRRLVAYCSRILGTLDPWSMELGGKPQSRASQADMRYISAKPMFACTENHMTERHMIRVDGACDERWGDTVCTRNGHWISDPTQTFFQNRPS